ncbi:MAG: hypothetical protein HQL09_05610 [Nitrospirae bacterium]|nr:hypothetical protein [Nitrospirota bacterium]
MLQFAMPLSCSIENLKGSRELVICDSELSRGAHKELFRFRDEAYVIGEADTIFNTILGLVEAFNSAPEFSPARIHIVLGWENILKVYVWKSTRPSAGDTFILLKNSGVSQQDLQPFKKADINDLFPWLYYGKQFSVLKKVCHAAKKQMENHLSDHKIRVDGHLVAEDSKRIVASSL